MINRSFATLAISLLLSFPVQAQPKDVEILVLSSGSEGPVLALTEDGAISIELNSSAGISSPRTPRTPKPPSLLKLCCLAYGCKFERDPVLGDTCSTGPKDCDFDGFQKCRNPPAPNPGPAVASSVDAEY